MNATPRTARVKKASEKPSEPRSEKTKLFNCTLSDGRVVVVSGLDKIDAGVKAHKKYKKAPVIVEPKPYERPKHMTDKPFQNHEGLAALKKSLEKN